MRKLLAMILLVSLIAGCSSHSKRAGFFFQAEDGIRDLYVTGVQTCALPISGARSFALHFVPVSAPLTRGIFATSFVRIDGAIRSEERRVGKECRSRWSAHH